MRTSFAATPLASIAHIEMGQSPDSSTIVEGGYSGVPFLQGNAEFGAAHPSPRFSCTAPMKMCRRGDILISVRAPVGAMNIANRDYCIGRGLAAVRVAGMSPALAAHMVSAAVPALRRVAQGTTFEAISKTDLASLLVMAPPQEDRDPLGRVLDTLDTTIRQTEAIIEKLKQVKQGLLHDLLTRGIDANGELRPPQSQAPHLYKDSPLGWIPVDWQVELLDDVAFRGSGHTPSKSIASYWDGGVRWVSLADSNRLDQIYIDSTDKEISDAGIANSSAVKHPAGTVILSRDAGVGKSAVLAAEMAVSQHFMAWRCSDRLANLYLYFKLQHMKPAFEAIALGSTVKTIGLDYFRKLRIPVPVRAEQDKGVEIMLAGESDVRRHESELGKLRLLKSGLMDDLLTGRVRVTPLLAPAAP